MRTVELPDVVAGPLRRHIDRAVTPVALADDTDPVHDPTFHRIRAAVRTSVGLPPRRGAHGLRHYYATVLIHARASVKTVQLSLGHSSPIITLNTYVHEWPDPVDRTRSLIDGRWAQRERRPRRRGAGRDRRRA